MNEKEMARQEDARLAPDVTHEGAMANLNLFYKVELGLQQVREGRAVSQEKAKARMQHWLE